MAGIYTLTDCPCCPIPVADCDNCDDAPVSPPSVGLIYWLEADAILGLVDDDPISTWPDQSSFGNDATQSGAARPTYRATDGPSGGPCVHYGGSQYFVLPTHLDSPPLTVATVWLAGGAGAIFGTEVDIGSPSVYYLDGGGHPVYLVRNCGNPISGDEHLYVGQWYVTGLRVGASRADTYLGSCISTTNPSPVACTPNGVSVLGADIFAGAGNWTGDMVAFLAWDTVLSEHDMHLALCYLRVKWTL